MRNIFFVISGPSGVGKGTLVKMILRENPNLALSISCTTRSPRPGEVDGREYFFITREEFLRRIEEGDFLEYDEHFDYFYGTPRSKVIEQLENHSVILEIDVIGGLHVRDEEHAKGENGVPVVLIMIVPPDGDALAKRLAHRGAETEEQLKTRRARVDYELSMQGVYDYIIVNDDLETAKAELLAVINQEINKD